MHSPVMALYQHLCNTGTAPEITIYLERRMCIEHIGISSSIRIRNSNIRILQFQLILNQLIGMITIL